MHTKLLSLLAAVAVGGTTGAVAYGGIRNVGERPTTPAAESSPAGTTPPVAEDCTPASTDPSCVIVVPLPASAGDDGSLDQGRGDVLVVPATAPGAGVPEPRGDGSLEDPPRAGDDDGTPDQGRGPRPEDDRDDDDRDDDTDRSGGDHGGSDEDEDEDDEDEDEDEDEDD